MLVSDDPIILEHKFPINRQKLWEYLTDLAHLNQWMFPQLTSYKAELGFETSFLIEHEGRNFPHNWKITDVIIDEKIDTQWSFDGYPGHSLVTYELKDDGEHSVLHLTAKALSDHPQDIPEFRRESGVGGWNFLIKESLSNYISKVTA